MAQMKMHIKLSFLPILSERPPQIICPIPPVIANITVYAAVSAALYLPT